MKKHFLRTFKANENVHLGESTAELTHVGVISLNPYVNLCKKTSLTIYSMFDKLEQ